MNVSSIKNSLVQNMSCYQKPSIYFGLQKRRFRISPSRWTQAADWLEFLSFTLWPVAFGAFSAWYWAWLLREAEEYKEYLNAEE
jgi:hypothetical protein